MTGICEANTYVSGNSVSTDSNDEIMAGALRQEKRQAKPLAKAHFMSSINLFLIAVLVFHNPERLMGQRAHCFFDAIAFLDTVVQEVWPHTEHIISYWSELLSQVDQIEQ